MVVAVMTGRRRSSGDLHRTVSLFRRFMGSPRPYVFGIVFLVIEALTSIVEPYPLAYLIDYLQGAKPDLRDAGAPALLSSPQWNTIFLLTSAVVLIAAINSAADSFTEVCMARGGRSLGYSVRVSMYSHLQRLPLGYHDKRRTGDVLTRVTGDVLVLEDFVVKSVSNIFGSLLVLLGSFAFLLWQSWKVASIALVVVPVLAAVSNHYSRRIKVASRTQRDREGDLASTAQEMLTSIRLVQSYGRGTVDLKQFSDQTARSMHASVGAANIQAQFSFVIALVEALSISAVVWLGVWLFDSGAITIGTLVLFVLLLENMFKPARKIVSEWYKIGKVFASVERIQDLLDREVMVRDLPDAVTAPALEGRLSFRHVSFAYPVDHEDGSKGDDRPRVLDNISFEAAPGEVVALVGYSGAGKSTIAQLVPRLYDPDDGEVLIDRQPVRRFTLASLRGQISLVLQETVLLSGTVAENIGYGIENATREDIQAAAHVANAHDFIMDLPNGYETVLGERGSTLSGGQRQRIAIARAFIRRAPILILDEPTTGLDVESAQTVVGALRSLMSGTTTIVISHDPGLIQSADRILVISDGRIVEKGVHENLLRSGGPYAELYAREAVPIRPDPLGAFRERLPELVKAIDDALWVTVWPSTLSPPASSDHPDRPDLFRPLRDRLPGLVKALDEGFAAEQIERMLGREAVVDLVSVGKLWLRDDGACNLRYNVRLADASTPVTNATVLGRVHPEPTAADAQLAKLRSLLDRREARRSTGLASEASLCLSRFPIDSDLTSLRLAADPSTVSRLRPFAGCDELPAVTVVHHAREGACVLRYRLRRSHAHFRSEPPPFLYGKVYGDHAGAVVDGFLRALARVRHAHGARYPVAFPESVHYEPRLRLLLTEELLGEPTVPRMLKQLLADGSEYRTTDKVRLERTVHASGSALAALHGSDLSTAPVRSAADELAGLRRELDVVARVWPVVANQIQMRIRDLADQVLDAPTMVLSHGDFTPSQVLLGDRSPAMVDLDTLCWADPALDLGRYLAYLHLRAAKAGGESAADLVGDLTEAFLNGYALAGARTAEAAAATDRIAFYKSTTLLRTALHACRQLKSSRYELAMSVLSDLRKGRVDP